MNTNIQEFKPLIKPNQLNDILPIDTATQNFVIKSRTEIQDIILKNPTKNYLLLVHVSSRCWCCISIC